MINTVEKSEWTSARRELLAAEKSLQAARDELAIKRRALPAIRLEVDYELLGENGSQSLSSLFGDQSQLLVYHFMFHPDWDEGCKSCSFWADSFDGAIAHLAARDVAFAVISRGPLDKLLAYRQRMGWSFPWLSSLGSTFNYDFDVSFTPEQMEDKSTRYNYRDGADVGSEMPGVSVFRRDDEGAIYHTYSCFARGLDTLNPVYQLLDLVPKGRDEADLPYPMDWVRRNDDY
jgi:predicted dithiol-disulfide oxidoreductase (DUF899 family)